VFAIDSVPGSFEILAFAGCSSATLPNGELPVPQLRVGLIDDDRHELYHRDQYYRHRQRR
jgi:hypothetical protein